MTSFAEFPSTSRNLGLPFLFAGQSQKEFFINHALTVIDGLLQHCIVGAAAEPPTGSHDGDCYLVASPALQVWEGRENHIAMLVGGDWQFIAPVDGAMIYDRQLNQYRHFKNGWQSAQISSAATGGAVIDAEARALLAELIDALGRLGLVAPTST